MWFGLCIEKYLISIHSQRASTDASTHEAAARVDDAMLVQRHTCSRGTAHHQAELDTLLDILLAADLPTLLAITR